MTFRPLRWIAVPVLLLALYAAVGFWGVPALVRWQLPRIAAAQLERPASVGTVRFNPFTLRLQLRDLRLDEADGSPLLAVQGIDADLEWRSLVQRAWVLREVRIDGPQAHLGLSRDGRFNVSGLVDTLRRHRSPPGPKDHGGTLPRVVVESFALAQGRLDWDDRQADTHAVLAPVELHFSRLSTLPNDKDAWGLTADLAGGGRVRWRGEGSLQPIRATGEIVAEDIPLPALGAYLKPYARVVVASGKLSATLPYDAAYDAGHLQAKLHGARLAIADLAAGRDGSTQRFATVQQLELRDVEADLVQRDATIGTVRLAGGELGLRRDARGAWDIAQLLVERQPPKPDAPATPWKVAVHQLQVAQLALRVLDESVQPPATLMATRIGAQVKLDAAQSGKALALQAQDGSVQVEMLTLAQAGRPPLTLERLGLEKVAVDLAKRHAEAGRVTLEGGQFRVVRDARGQIDLASLLPKPSTAAEPQGPAWTARAEQVALSRIAIDIDDQGSGLHAQLQDLALKVDGAGTDLAKPVHFDGSLRVREGGQLALQGQLVPASRSVDAQLQVRRLALAAAQPVLAKHLRLVVASGTLDAQGRVQAAFTEGKAAQLRYTGRAALADLRLDEADGKTLFARWKTLSADRLAVGTGGVDVPELRVVAAEASLIINEDRTFNATRLLVHAPAATPAPTTRHAAVRDSDPFPVRIGRVRLDDSRLDFQDRSLRPEFGARVYALNGVVTGLSSRKETRSQVQLDGRVDQYGLARVRGSLNAFAPRDSTDLDVVFRNVNLVPASPYAMKFAGYRIAEGRISLDLRYRVHDGHLDGDNKIVIDQLQLGERVDSADALKLPLELAIAVLKDPEGRIDLGIPVTGDLNDPQFSYAAVIGKALGNVLARIASAPFRALAGLFGGSGEKLGAVQFDPGSAQVLPPEREQLAHVADMLAKRPQLRLTVPAQYSEAADGAALRVRSVREAIAQRAGLRLQPGEAPGPLDYGSRPVREAVRALYTQRFGDQAWDQAKTAAESQRPRGEASGAAGSSSTSLPVLRRLSNLMQGEPQVTDPAGFYRGLARKLEQDAPLAPEALAQLGEERAKAVVAALTQAGVAASRVSAAAPASVAAEAGKPVPLTLQLAAQR